MIKSGLSTKYMVSTYQPTEDVYVQADKNYYYKTNSGQFLKATVHTGDSIATIQASLGTIFENVMQPKTSIQQVSYLNDNDAVSYVGATASGSLFDVVQRAILAERVYVDGINASSVYTQPIAFKLQNMMIKSEPVKWLIGDDSTGYTEDFTMEAGMLTLLKASSRTLLIARTLCTATERIVLTVHPSVWRRSCRRSG